jgi:pyruvate dehydrogenase E2 component (dihydrolipoamide acetyltransferase)
MAVAINMPQVGQDIDFARIIEWHVREGDEVKEGDVLATVESDKASFEVEASESGIVLRLLFDKDDEAAVFKPIAYIGKKGESVLDEKEKTESLAGNLEAKVGISSAVKEELRTDGLFSSPSARRLARENNLELSEITGS